MTWMNLWSVEASFWQQEYNHHASLTPYFEVVLAFLQKSEYLSKCKTIADQTDCR